MKKILAGVLAAASMLAVSATAFATDKNVTKPGEVEYDVAVTAPAVTLNLIMPAKLSAALNPYGADIKLDKDNTTKNTIASAAYKVTNKSTDYGVYIDAKAITTISTPDKPVDGKPAWSVTKTALPATADGVKNANLALMGFTSVSSMKTATPAAANAVATNSAQGALVLDSTVEADKENGIVAGQTEAKKFMYIKAATDASTFGEAYMGFVGKLAESKADGSKDVVWNEDDAINVTLVLKVTAGPKTLASS